MLSLTTITAILFSVSLIFTYLWVRLNWVSVPNAFIVGYVFNSLTFFMFAIARGNVLTSAISVGFLQGLIFTIAAVSMGLFFRQNSQKDIARQKRELDYSLETMPRDLKA